MDNREEQGGILQILKHAFATDKMKPKVIDITHLNLVEMTRMKARKNLSSILYSTCPVRGAAAGWNLRKAYMWKSGVGCAAASAREI